MTIEAWQIWLISFSSEFKRALDTICVMTTVGVFGVIAFFAISGGPESLKAVCAKWLKIFAGIWLSATLAQSLVPRSEALAAMWVIPPLVNSESVQKLPGELIDYARAWLKHTMPIHEEAPK